MSLYSVIEEKLNAGEIIILDGGTSTDIQRRGVPMNADTWSADANLTHPDIVRAVHEDYIAAGADIIIANTFATSPLLFNHLGRDDDITRLDAAAVSIAKQASQERVPVAGSFSTMRPIMSGSDRTSRQREWSKKEAKQLMKRKAESLVAAGVDFIMMEMMRDLDYSLWATEAAVATGIPVWVGISVETDSNGKLTGFGREDFAFEDIVAPLMEAGGKVLSIMHSSPNDTTKAIPIAQTKWKGPLGAYPESGYLAMPDWKFVDIIPVPAFVELAKAWAERDVTILGGCCGIGPDHIKALVDSFNEVQE
ncbi:MAG TPA: homocysteine S-methyltransferase family protein [Aestuariivirgaceae bacterium]